MRMGVIISTYNSPQWLQKVLWGYECQTDGDFDTIIADDGSGSETRRLVDDFRQRGRLNLHHVWHTDDGFRKTEILNRAIEQNDCDYLMLTDGDCVPRRDVVALHKSMARPGHYLSAGYFKLTRPVSHAIGQADIESGRAFTHRFLRDAGQPLRWKNARIAAPAAIGRLMNRMTPTVASWNGAQSSTWKSDLIAANGFDTRMQYGGEDRELGERLVNAGMKGIQIRYTAICLHLDHDRGYVTKEMWANNDRIRQQTKVSGRTRTPWGIVDDSAAAAA
ncbi:glycosyltransferase family 2 protein [Crateriforma spongiae]|uniref:glycosyltransferase family 2 protein n=2 Tax=Crateriforma spongiae TaxID=2724528 RepID=UPI001444EFBE